MNESNGPQKNNLAPGWESINALLHPIYGDQEPLHWGTMIRYSIGGPDPLDGISAYRRDTPLPHWHYVTFGLSEIYEKESENPDVSGWGFELTFRLARGQSEDKPPDWVLNFLQNLARYVFETANPFGAGHHMHLNGPIALDSDTLIHAIAFRKDPELSPIDSPNGRLEFLQVVGLTDNEYLSCLRWNTDKVLDVVSANIPALITDIARGSLLEIPSVRTEIDTGAKTDGSSTHILYTDHSRWSERRAFLGHKTTIALGVNTAEKAALVLPGRVPFGEALTIASPQGAITFEPGAKPECRSEPDNHLILALPSEAAERLAALFGQGVGKHPVPLLPRVTIEIEPSVIRDHRGNVVRTVT